MATRKTPGTTRKKVAAKRRVTAKRDAEQVMIATKTAKKKGAAKAAKKSNKHKTKAKQVLSDDEFMGSFWRFFSGLPAFTFVAEFPGREWWSDGAPLGPTLTSAVDLLIRARHGSSYRGPYMDLCAEVMGIDFATAAKRRREIVIAVESRIAELRRRGIEFAVCWCAYGDEPRLDWSGDGEDWDYACEQLAERCKEHLDSMLE